jgi:MEMO1 family protein
MLATMPIQDPALTPESIRATMAIPSTERMRGLKDGVGFARTPEAMAAVFAASSGVPTWTLGPAPEAPWAGAICPHDDFLYAGRVYRRALAGIQAKTVIVIGTFHGWRKFETRLGLFDTRETWWTPDGPVRVSELREAAREWPSHTSHQFPSDDAAFDAEHSIEPIVAWLRHQRPDVEIVPILPPGGDRPDTWLSSARLLGLKLGYAINNRGLEFGKDVAVVISADAVHYGPDFGEQRFGEGPEAYEQAVAEDLRIIRTLLSGPVDGSTAIGLHETLVDPDAESLYRWTWCGRYAIPFGIVLLEELCYGMLTAWPLAYETSISAPPLGVDMPPLGFTAAASHDHFVGYPAVAFTFEPRPGAGEI